MKIAIDLRALQVGNEFRGIGAYLVNVLTRMPMADSGHEFVFLRFADGNPLGDLGLDLAGVDYDEVVVERIEVTGRVSRVRKLLVETFWSSFGGIRSKGVDVFWQPDFLLGVPRLPDARTVVTMYDLIPMAMPAEYLPTARQLLAMEKGPLLSRARLVLGGTASSRKYRRCISQLKRADRILSISEWTTLDLQRLLHLSPAVIQTIHLGAPLLAPAADLDEVIDTPAPADFPTELNDRQFLLFIGGVDRRRRFGDLVVAFDELRARGHDLDLVLVGRDLENLSELHHVEGLTAMRQSPNADRIHNLGFVSEIAKHWLYSHAVAFVFPSLYEGFGLPLLEAMVNSCPVITYRNTSLTEVAGDAAILLDRPGPEGIASAVERLITDPSERASLVKAGLERAAEFSWDRCAQETLSAIESTGR